MHTHLQSKQFDQGNLPKVALRLSVQQKSQPTKSHGHCRHHVFLSEPTSAPRSIFKDESMSTTSLCSRLGTISQKQTTMPASVSDSYTSGQDGLRDGQKHEMSEYQHLDYVNPFAYTAGIMASTPFSSASSPRYAPHGKAAMIRSISVPTGGQTPRPTLPTKPSGRM